jgi:hypothetical protein
MIFTDVNGTPVIERLPKELFFTPASEAMMPIDKDYVRTFYL